MTQKTRFRNQIVAFKYCSVLVNIPRFHIHRGAQLVTVNGCPLDFILGGERMKFGMPLRGQ
jgi:hypothetical protein